MRSLAELFSLLYRVPELLCLKLHLLQILTYATLYLSVYSHNRQSVHKLFPININTSVQTLYYYHLVQRKWFWCRLHKREGKSNSYSSGHHKNEACPHKMKA